MFVQTFGGHFNMHCDRVLSRTNGICVDRPLFKTVQI